MLKKIILSILSGLILFLSWPPNTSFIFLIFISLVPLFIIASSEQDHKLNLRNYYIYIYLAFFLFNLCTTSWVRHAHFAGAVFAILCNSFFMTFVFFLYNKIKNALKLHNPLWLLPILWIAFEYLHLNWDLSWPWLTLGNVFAGHTLWIQWYSITGVLGGTLWVFIINLLFFQLYRNIYNSYFRNIYLSIIIISIFTPMCFSLYMYEANKLIEAEESVNVLVVQPNIDPYKEKFSISQQDQTISMLNFISSEIDSTLDYIILPETFLSSPIWHHKMEQNIDVKFFNQLIRQYPNLNLVVGSMILKLSPKSATAKSFSSHKNQFYQVHNAAVHLNNLNLNYYFKSKLVPGAEKMPFQNILYPFIKDKVLKIGNSTSVGNFTKQDTVSLFSSSKNYLSAPIICYESIYGDYVRKFISKGAQVIFIITNDGWWKKTSGFQQHNMYATLRAIETRRYVARSANTGVSSIINQLGEIELSVDWDKKSTLKQCIPLYNKKTFYVQHGDFLGRISAFLAIVILLFSFVENKRSFLNK
jgi:apolipoprotein N-acyltransferase